MDFSKFVDSYWNYYLELEGRMEETRRYVEYDNCNHNTFSSNYLMLYQAVCSEIDVVGKEAARHFADDSQADVKKRPSTVGGLKYKTTWRRSIAPLVLLGDSS